jgi:hypothetical protein
MRNKPMVDDYHFSHNTVVNVNAERLWLVYKTIFGYA